MLRALAVLIPPLWLFGCGAFSDTYQVDQDLKYTPAPFTQVDDFDGSTIVVQPMVSMAGYRPDGKMYDTRYKIGFLWFKRNPKVVVIMLKRYEIESLSSLRFNVGGREIATVSSGSTDFDVSQYGGSSSNRFALPLDDFLVIAASRDVGVKIGHLNTYTAIRYGASHGATPQQVAIGRYLQAIDRAGAPGLHDP